MAKSRPDPAPEPDAPPLVDAENVPLDVADTANAGPTVPYSDDRADYPPLVDEPQPVGVTQADFTGHGSALTATQLIDATSEEPPPGDDGALGTNPLVGDRPTATDVGPAVSGFEPVGVEPGAGEPRRDEEGNVVIDALDDPSQADDIGGGHVFPAESPPTGGNQVVGAGLPDPDAVTEEPSAPEA